MKTPVVFILACFVLCSCAEHTIDKSETRLPVLERHYNMETGEAIAEKSYVYDKYRNLIRESYKLLTPKTYQYGVYSYEINYEYDAQQNRILMLTRYLGETESYSLVRFVYDGNKKVEEQYYTMDVNSQRPHTKTTYYYSGAQADSSVTLVHQYFIDRTDAYNFSSASYFKYDNQERLIEEQRRPAFGSKWVASINDYDGDLLQKSCNPVTGQEGVFNCTRYEYNSQKNLIRKYATFTGTPDRLLEEHTYTEGLRAETKIFNQNYYLLVYGDPSLYTLQIKYEY